MKSRFYKFIIGMDNIENKLNLSVYYLVKRPEIMVTGPNKTNYYICNKLLNIDKTLGNYLFFAWSENHDVDRKIYGRNRFLNKKYLINVQQLGSDWHPISFLDLELNSMIGDIIAKFDIDDYRNYKNNIKGAFITMNE